MDIRDIFVLIGAIGSFVGIALICVYVVEQFFQVDVNENNININKNRIRELGKETEEFRVELMKIQSKSMGKR